MTHLLTKIIPHAELKELFDSAETQDFLRENSQKTAGEVPFLYEYVSNDNPYEDLAIAWIFPGGDTVWIEFLILDDVQYIPEYPAG